VTRCEAGKDWEPIHQRAEGRAQSERIAYVLEVFTDLAQFLVRGFAFPKKPDDFSSRSPPAPLAGLLGAHGENINHRVLASFP
jgi:hypothetical protein